MAVWRAQGGELNSRLPRTCQEKAGDQIFPDLTVCENRLRASLGIQIPRPETLSLQTEDPTFSAPSRLRGLSSLSLLSEAVTSLSFSSRS